LDVITNIAGTGLDSSLTLPANSHLLALVQKSARNTTEHHTKTDIVVPVVGRVPVAIGRTAVVRRIVPRPTAQHSG